MLFQALFLALYCTAFWVYYRSVFALLPLPGISNWHTVTGALAAVPCLVLFFLASCTDPGTITKDNVAACLARYPHDGVLYTRRACGTCNLMKPARSKHCRICNRCIARMDHHCIWLNNCVGERNLGLFLAFLAATSAVCAYGAVMGVRIMRAHMAASGAWRLARVHPTTGDLQFVGDSGYSMLAYVLARYPPQVCVLFFLGVIAWLLMGFLGYHAYLVAAGMTTNEAGKWRVLRRDLARQATYDGPAAAGVSLLPRNAYDRGAWANLREALGIAGHAKLC